MTLKDLLEQDFGRPLPISGGDGNSIDNPIIIHKTPMNDYVGVEYYILKCLGIGRRIKLKMLGQMLLEHDGKKIDQIKIETEELTETQVITTVENYYFDITECFGLGGGLFYEG